MTNLIVWLVVGSAAGWLISMAMRSETPSAVVLNLLAGAVGAVLGGSALSPLVGTASGNQNEFSVSALLSALVGTAILLAAVQYFRRKPAR
jgi:uncharacterized membrane protein YeaQ/YmgE (transglycosylase-associated protein family)